MVIRSKLTAKLLRKILKEYGVEHTNRMDKEQLIRAYEIIFGKK
jgi:hypothetical protein